MRPCRAQKSPHRSFCSSPRACPQTPQGDRKMRQERPNLVTNQLVTSVFGGAPGAKAGDHPAHPEKTTMRPKLRNHMPPVMSEHLPQILGKLLRHKKGSPDAPKRPNLVTNQDITSVFGGRPWGKGRGPPSPPRKNYDAAKIAQSHAPSYVGALAPNPGQTAPT